MMRSPLFKTKGTTGSRIETDLRIKVSRKATIVTMPDQETTRTGMENIASTARSRTTPKKNAGKESEKINRAKTNKGAPIGRKCT